MFATASARPLAFVIGVNPASVSCMSIALRSSLTPPSAMARGAPSQLTAEASVGTTENAPSKLSVAFESASASALSRRTRRSEKRRHSVIGVRPPVVSDFASAVCASAPIASRTSAASPLSIASESTPDAICEPATVA
ncbi:MAG: hypothetical protein DWH96_06545 [Planctomycetota bacterium]|nr:MAG: hypothetical protein DWH96_06545 [Planctomycetota bacterium]RLS94383.1 MAG: hypothetical protein DWI11_05000 [Planctomycetota bacterium]RLT00472.1 MAG: hypothetical protein DWI20_01310 [Planctomycetota bacterium]